MNYHRTTRILIFMLQDIDINIIMSEKLKNIINLSEINNLCIISNN